VVDPRRVVPLHRLHDRAGERLEVSVLEDPAARAHHLRRVALQARAAMSRREQMDVPLPRPVEGVAAPAAERPVRLGERLAADRTDQDPDTAAHPPLDLRASSIIRTATRGASTSTTSRSYSASSSSMTTIRSRRTTSQNSFFFPPT